MKLYALSLALLLGLTALSARAEEHDPQNTPIDTGALYDAFCQPAKIKASDLSHADKKEAIELHREFAAFLRNPAPTVAELSQLADSKDISDSLSFLMGYAMSCGFFESLGSLIDAHGCVDEKGKTLDASNARKLCAPLAEKARKQ